MKDKVARANNTERLAIAVSSAGQIIHEMSPGNDAPSKRLGDSSRAEAGLYSFSSSLPPVLRRWLGATPMTLLKARLKEASES